MGRRVWALLVGLVALWLAAPAWAQQWTAAPVPEPVELPAVPADWVSVPGTWLVVHGDESHTGLMTQVARQGSIALPELADRLGVPIGTTVHVYLAEDDAEFRALQPGVPPAWADATAWPTLGAVFLRTPGARGPTDAPLEQVLEHELVHILLGRAFAPEAPPHWLQEGVARTLAGEVGPEDGRILQQSAIVGGPMSLRSLERGFPADHRRAQLAYAAAGDFVSWLMAEHGPDTLPVLVRASAGGATMRQAVREATGLYLEDAEQAWHARWAAGSGLGGVELAALITGDLMFVFGAGVLAVAFVQRRLRFRRRLREMEQEEALVDALMADLRSQVARGG